MKSFIVLLLFFAEVSIVLCLTTKLDEIESLLLGGNLTFNPDGIVTTPVEVFVSSTVNSVSTLTGAIVTAGGIGVAQNMNIGGEVAVESVLSVTSTENSVSTATGAIVTAGGIGVAQDVNIGGTATIQDRVTATSTENSVSTVTGAIVTAGGAGIAQDVNIGGNVTVEGVLHTERIDPIGFDLEITKQTHFLDDILLDGSLEVLGGIENYGGMTIFGANLVVEGTVTASEFLTSFGIVSICFFRQSAENVITADTSDQSIIGTGIGTLTVPANTLSAGKTLRIRGAGAILITDVVSSNPTITIRYLDNSSGSLQCLLPIPVSDSVALAWDLEIIGTYDSTANAVLGSVNFSVAPSLDADYTVTQKRHLSQSWTIASDKTITITAAFDVTNAFYAFTTSTFVFELL